MKSEYKLRNRFPKDFIDAYNEIETLDEKREVGIEVYKGAYMKEVEKDGKTVRVLDEERLKRTQMSDDHMFDEFTRVFMYWNGYYYPEYFVHTFLGHLKVKPRSEWTDEEVDRVEQGGKKPIYDSPEFHNDMIDSRSKGNTCDLFFRGAGKTTMLICHDIYDICYARHTGKKEIMTVSTDKMIKKIVKNIRVEFEANELIRWVFGEMVPSQKTIERAKMWNNRVLHFRNGVQYHGISKGSTVRGMRPNKVNIDDPQDEKDVRNADIADEFYWWVLTSVTNTLDRGGTIHITGTDLGERSLVRKIFNNKENTYIKNSYPAVIDAVWEHGFLKSGTPLWPSRYTIDHFNNLIRDIGKDAFMQEYQNEARQRKDSRVFSDDIKYMMAQLDHTDNDIEFFVPYGYRPQGPVYYGLDTASGSDDGDYSAIVGYDKGKLICQYKARVDSRVLAEKMVYILKTRGLQGIVIPEKNFSEAIFNFLRDEYNLGHSLYVQTQGDDRKASNRRKKTLGFTTTAKSKQTIIENYKASLINTHANLMNIGEPKPMRYNMEVSPEILSEIKTFEYDYKRRPNASSGNHDDLLMAAMIAQHICQKQHIERYNKSMILDNALKREIVM